MTDFEGTLLEIQDEIVTAVGRDLSLYLLIMDQLDGGYSWNSRLGIDRDAFDAVEYAINKRNETIDAQLDEINIEHSRSREQRRRQRREMRTVFENQLQEKLV
jgi:hypothetical protein